VRRNGGRVGAALGPAKFREFLQKVGTVKNPEFDIDLKNISLTDNGDVFDDRFSLEQAHAALHATVLEIISKGKIPFVIGGGNDQSFPNGLALLKHYENNVGIINIDAHLDVRPLKEGKTHSGSPFRQLLQSEEFKVGTNNSFAEFAAQGGQCSAVHADYVREQKGSIYWLNKLQSGPDSVCAQFQQVVANLGERVFVSFDIDSIRSSDCPGVSAPAAVGISAQDALDICFAAGSNPKVKLFDLSEFNPRIEDYRTGRLVAFMFYYFALGLASRKL